ncbi:hypothetical protein A2U01_0059638, partial [Trifolium medium]|nr:hypothetical protein [Trifolium medium]
MRGEPIQVGEMIAWSIKRMITGPDSYIGHPFVITALCRLREVPTEEATDEISSPEWPIGQTFFRREVRELQPAQAAAATPQPPPQPAAQQEQHQDPPHIPQQHLYSDFELGMAATLYEQHYRMD